MARLIPSFMDDRTPPGEHDVFNMLGNGPDDWVALHALDLAPWNRNLRTEIDFVLVVPDTGILCIEVKSHENISFDGARWHPATITRSPFKQALDGRHTLYRRLTEIAPQFKSIPIVHFCIFPRSQFEVGRNISVQTWEVMDRRAFQRFKSGLDFCSDLKLRMGQAIDADGHLRHLENRLSQHQIESLIKLCVPVQKVRPDAREEIERREEAIEKLLLEQQRPVLQLAAQNDRIIVSGGAGTGKTLIAMEVARRAAETGKRVGLLCYNQLVGKWVKEKMDKLIPPAPNLVVGRAIRVMAEMAAVEVPEKPSKDFWESELPDRLEEIITNPEFKAVAAFDYLVVDEAQDILAKPFLWRCLTEFLSGGENDGAFALFGDFDHQVLADRDAMRTALDALDHGNRPTRWKLSDNCRNYRIVGDTAVRLAGFDDGVYASYLRSGGGLHNYDIYFYEDDKQQLGKLSQWLKEFRAEGYKAEEITVLSFCSDDQSSAGRLASSLKLRPVWQGGPYTHYTTVHAFKGLESKVVILSDVLLNDHNFQRDLFYAGLTRATESVRVLCEQGSRGVLTKWLSGK